MHCCNAWLGTVCQSRCLPCTAVSAWRMCLYLFESHTAMLYVQKGKLEASALPFVSALKMVDLPTLGTPGHQNPHPATRPITPTSSEPTRFVCVENCRNNPATCFVTARTARNATISSVWLVARLRRVRTYRFTRTQQNVVRTPQASTIQCRVQCAADRQY